MTLLNTPEISNPELTSDLEKLSPEGVLEWALNAFSPKVALACSFQAEGSVLIDM